MKKIAQNKFTEGMKKLAQKFAKIDATMRDTMAQHEKLGEQLIEQTQQSKNVWAGGQSQDQSQERPRPQGEAVGVKQE